MANWSEIYNERSRMAPDDDIRQKYLKRLAKLTGRNVIAYYSGWLQNPYAKGVSIDDSDMNAFMATINKLDKAKGLDLILHTPGGDIAATEAIIKYLHNIFGNNIRAIVPQMAMSAGAMIACSCKSIVMGKHSNIGPVDPQMYGVPCQAMLEEFNTAIEDAKNNPASIIVWQNIINKYSPTTIIECQKAVIWANTMVEEWLEKCMFSDHKDAKEIAKSIAEKMSSHDKHKTHSRHISADECKEIGLIVEDLEQDDKLQDAVLSVHHAYIISLGTPVSPIKIVENNIGGRMLFNANTSK